ncbi:MAG: hypothetical protein R2738_09370 [Bacteroides graminisolvens]
MQWPDYQYEFGQGLPSNVGKAGTEYAGQLYYSYGAAPDGNSSTSGTSSAYGGTFRRKQNVLSIRSRITRQSRNRNTLGSIQKTNRKDLFQTGLYAD